VAENALRFSFLATDRASPTFDKLAKKSDGLGSKMTAMGKGIALATAGVAAGGVAALGAAFIQGVKDAASFEVLAKRTASVIKSTGNTAHISVKGVQGLAASLESLSGVDESLIINSENVLATFTKVRNESGRGRDIFNQATTAALNMSVALGTDLQGATIQVGKALNDPIKGISALRRVGVSFTDAQKKQIETLVKSGNVMGAQKIILKELSVEFGGAAKAAGDTFSGKIARAKDAVGDFARDMGQKALPALGSLADWVTTSGIPRLSLLITFVTTTLVPGVVAGFAGIKAKVEAVLPNIDLSKLGSKFAAQAKGWATSIIGGVRIGLDGGDWKPLGVSLGKGIVSAIQGAGRFAADIAGKIGDLLAKVDWLGLGIKVGKVAVPLLVGIAVGLLNFDLLGLLKGLASHWQEALFAVLAIAFTPAKVIGAVARLLGKIPLIGPLLAWALTHFKSFSNGVVRAVGKALGFMGKAFLEGFRRVFPGVGAGFAKALSLFPTWLGVTALRIRAAALRMMQGLGAAITSRIGAVVAKIGELIARMIRPFANAAGWLVRRGVDFVTGLIRGAASRLGAAASTARRVISTVTSPFRGALGWLYQSGRMILVGLRNGMFASLRNVGSWAKAIGARIVGAVKSFFGIKSPSTVFAGIGGHLMAGLARGMLAANPVALIGRVFGSMPKALGAIVDKGLVSIASLPGKALNALAGLGGKFAGLIGGGGGGVGGGVQRWASLVSYVLRLLGQSQAWLPAVLRRMQRESGGNPQAINRWDINALRGDPSRGLMQTIGSTFNAYAGVFRGRGIYDPLANIYAGLNYALARYGSLAVMDRPGGYAQGGWLMPGQLAYNETRRPEAIFNEQQLQALGGGGTTVNVYLQVGPTADKKAIGREILGVLEDFVEGGGQVPRRLALKMQAAR